MPLYEYQCDACGHRFEKIQKYSDPLEDKCPKCGGAVQKLLSSPAIQFKGSGWYITDYARKSGGGDSSSKSTTGTSDNTSKSTDSASKSGDTSSSTSAPASTTTTKTE